MNDKQVNILNYIADALCDGEVLAANGIDQETAENAYDELQQALKGIVCAEVVEDYEELTRTIVLDEHTIHMLPGGICIENVND